MIISTCYGMLRDAKSDGDGLKALADAVCAKYKQAVATITVVPHALDMPIGVVTRPWIVAAHSAGCGAAIKYARDAGHEIDLMILSDPYVLMDGGKLIADTYVQPAFVKRLVAYRQTVGLLHGKPIASGHNYSEVILPEDPNVPDNDEHMRVLKRPEVMAHAMAEIERVAKAFGVT